MTAPHAGPRTGPHADWGEVSPRWAGVRSLHTEVHGTPVHYLEAGSGLPHLLVHPMAGSATMWLDAVPPLSRLGRVIVPDLPGTVFGHTACPHPRAAKAEPSARFLRAFASRLGLEKAVVHGWSMGGLVAVLFAASAPSHVERLVLAAPALPGPLPEGEERFWRTWGRLALAVGAPLTRAALALAGRRLLDAKLRMYTDPEVLSRSELLGGDMSRVSPQTRALLAEQLRTARPERLGAAVTAFASTMTALFVDRHTVHEAIARIGAPALLLWGGQDGLVAEGTIDDLAARRPDWEHRVFETAGHLLPQELPDAYAEAVGGWIGRS
ncbi:alpha/beta fold hydrolase [Thermoactinospora rubra]|uniref:alpha/beta fold hydrolase n=1 Tax=Thermoactinospora rubra TaxID=1088767 RepID=UPI000A0FDEA8|nr:alpha/beta hydrolase [Thermoactinospora rubra]